MSLIAVDSDEYDLDIPVDGFQGCSSKFSDMLYGKLFRSFRYSKLKRSERFNMQAYTLLSKVKLD